MANTRSILVGTESQDICFLDDLSFGGSFLNTGSTTIWLMFDLTAPATVGSSSIDLRPGDLYETAPWIQGRVAAIGEDVSTMSVTLRGENAFI